MRQEGTDAVFLILDEAQHIDIEIKEDGKLPPKQRKFLIYLEDLLTTI